MLKVFLTIFGIISLGLGILGAFLPVLPTTPLLLLAAACFLRSNRRLYDWLMNHPKLGVYLKNFLKHKAIPICAIFVAEHWALRALFLAIAIGVTIHILSYKTLRP